MLISEQLTELRDFLVPENGQNKLIRNWDHMAETKEGYRTVINHEQAVKFCLLGGLYQLKLDLSTKKFMDKFALSKKNYKVPFLFFFKRRKRFLYSSWHSTKEVKNFLNQAIESAKEQEL